MSKRMGIQTCVVLAAGALLCHLPAGAASQTGQPEETITFSVRLPADAKLDIDGKPTRKTGAIRTFRTPPLAPGTRYTYTLTATANGKEVTRPISIAHGGDNLVDLRADFRQAAADQPQAEQPAAAQDKEVVSSKGTPRPAASSVNFRKELNLPFPTLSTLGGRISAARRSADPVALAHAASELAVAEKVSGKKASLTSATILKESADLAKLRRQTAELQAVENVAHQIEVQQEIALELKKEIALAQTQAKADADFLKSNEEPGWTPRKLIVNNYTTQIIDVYVNGNFKMRVAPGGMQVGFIEHRWNPVTLTGYGDEDNITWGPQYLWGKFNKYTWNIN